MVRDNHFEVPRDDVAAWEPALAVMLQELQLSVVLRHPGLIEVFEAAGLGLTPDGVYRLAFGSNLKQQALLRPPGSGIVRTVVIDALRRAGIDVADVRPVSPGLLGWERSLGNESMTMTEQNEQAPAVCQKCSATLIGGRDLPGCWRCGWEDYSQPGTGITPLIGSSISELAAMGRHSRQ